MGTPGSTTNPGRSLPVDVVIPAWGPYLAWAPRAMASVPDAARHIVVTDPGVRVTPVGGVALTILVRSGASLGAARNVGLAGADAEFVVFLDADDAMIPGALASMVAAARRRPSADVFFGLFLAPSGVVWPPRRQARLMSTPLALPMLLANNTLPMTGTLLRRRALPLDLFPPVRSEDWPAAVRMRARSRVVFLDRAVLDYATQHGSRSRSRIDRTEISATRRELLVALLSERRGAPLWRVVDRLAGRRRHRLDAELALYDHVPAIPVPQ